MDRFNGNRAPYVRTIPSGECFDLINPQPEDFNFGDMAWHLAGLFRYTGGSRISVGQHCVVAARMASRFYPDHPLLPARMLIHDGVEYAYGDVASPLKQILPGYRELETYAERQLEKACDLLFIGDPLVKEVDTRMWLTERQMVYMDAACTDEELASDYTGDLLPFEVLFTELMDNFSPWSPDSAEKTWTRAFKELLPWVQW